MVPIFVDSHEPTVDYEEVEHFGYAFAHDRWTDLASGRCPLMRVVNRAEGAPERIGTGGTADAYGRADEHPRACLIRRPHRDAAPTFSVVPR